MTLKIDDRPFRDAFAAAARQMRRLERDCRAAAVFARCLRLQAEQIRRLRIDHPFKEGTAHG